VLRSIAALSFATVLLGAPSMSIGLTWHVPSQCPTIQAGIDSASAGDTVFVACGTYYEHDIVMKSGIYLTSETGQADCVMIDAGDSGRILYCDSVDSLAEVVGCTMTRGNALMGGALYCSNSSPRILNTIFYYNGGYAGGAVLCEAVSSPAFTSCTFFGNGFASGMPPHCYGGAVYLVELSSSTFTACVFSNNRTDFYGPIMSEGTPPALHCCNLYGNSYGSPAGENPSDWYGIEDQLGVNGNISEDPLFCDPWNGNLGVGPDSPNLPANNSCDVLIGAVGESCTAEEAARVEATSWSTLKAFYR